MSIRQLNHLIGWTLRCHQNQVTRRAILCAREGAETMKKIFLLILCVFLLTGCSSATTLEKWQQEPVSTDIVPYAKRVVEVIDAYLAFQMSADEAGAAIDDIYKHMDGQNIRTKDDIYSDYEQSIVSDIYLLSGSGIARRTDIELRQYRDEIAFAIGEPVTGYIYEAERNIWDEDDPLADLINVDDIPFYSGSADVTDNLCMCALSFDEMNIQQFNDLQKYIKDVYDRLSVIEKPIKMISAHYRRYGQSVYYISIIVNDGKFSGTVRRADRLRDEAWDAINEAYTREEVAAMERYPAKYNALNPLYEFDSIEDLATALKVAGKFAGVQ